MTESKRYTFKQILISATWILIGMGTVVLLVAAINKKKGQRCHFVDIHITGVRNNFFIDNNDVTKILGQFSRSKLEGKPINTFDLSSMEKALKKNEWIMHAELFFDNNDILKVNIFEREPIARIFCNTGLSYYIDTSRLRLPLSEKFSARLPVFTNFPTENRVLSQQDSNLLTGIKLISEFIARDSFWMAQIEQVDITSERTFEMIPKIGQQVIIFGDATNYKQKFSNLLLFYKQVESKVGWNKYAKINVQYAGQIIAEKRGAQEVKMDSMRTIQLMKLLVANAIREANDTLHNIQLIQPPEENTIPNPLVEANIPGEDFIRSLNPKKTLPVFHDSATARVVLKPSRSSASQSHVNIKKAVIKKPVYHPIVTHKPVKTINDY